jgi:hypothetical protein
MLNSNMKSIRVGKPLLRTSDSFESACADSSTRMRTARAKKDWTQTDLLKVQAYSYSSSAVRLCLGALTLEIAAFQSMVDWKLCESAPFPTESAETIRLVWEDSNSRQTLFNRDAILQSLIGKPIRYAPSANELYLSWKTDSEIGFYSLPLVDESGWLLFYDGGAA